MQSGEIPERFDPRRLARESAQLRGTISGALLERLATSVLEVGESASLDAVVSVDEFAHPLIAGSAEVPIKLRCQRCMEPMAQTLQVRFRLAVVRSEADAERLPEEMDAVIVEGDSIDTAALMEDEFILALPIVARHERLEDCDVERRYLTPQSGGTAWQPEETSSPFAALEALKRNGDD